jgi:hypothetical protein
MNLFLENKYTKTYYAIINRAKSRQIPTNVYVEKHHIIPRSLGGDNSDKNLIKLSAREHFICHLLLTKMVVGLHKQSMCYAAWQMTHIKGRERYKPSSRMYDILRKKLSAASKGIPKSEDAKRNMSLAQKGKTGTPHTEEHKKYMSSLYKGKSKNYSSFLGKTHSTETKQKQSVVKRGRLNPNFGKMQTEESNRLKSLAQIGISKPTFVCNCCGKTVGGKSNLLRWHNDNCKEKQNY